MMELPFDPNKPYCRRDGKPARIICTDAKGSRPLIVLYPLTPDYEGIYRLNMDGTEYGSGLGQQSKYDLINLPEKVEGWVNIYSKCEVHETKDYADSVAKNASTPRIACIPISFIEGEGLK